MPTNIIESLRSLAVPISSLVPDPENARLHGKRNLDAVKASLTKFGQRQPIVVQSGTMIVRAGNARLLAATEMGWDEIAAVIVDENDQQAKAFAIADNRTAELAEWDFEVLSTQFAELLEEDAAMITDYGWDQKEVDMLIAADWTPPEIADLTPPDRDEPGGHVEQTATSVLLSFTAEQRAIFDAAAAADGFLDPVNFVLHLCGEVP